MTMKKQSIEEYMNQLEQITQKMHDPDIPLDEAMELYKKGIQTANAVEEMLEKYQQELVMLNPDKEVTEHAE